MLLDSSSEFKDLTNKLQVPSPIVFKPSARISNSETIPELQEWTKDQTSSYVDEFVIDLLANSFRARLANKSCHQPETSGREMKFWLLSSHVRWKISSLKNCFLTIRMHRIVRRLCLLISAFYFNSNDSFQLTNLQPLTVSISYDNLLNGITWWKPFSHPDWLGSPSAWAPYWR